MSFDEKNFEGFLDKRKQIKYRTLNFHRALVFLRKIENPIG